jgi:hypothetical protein
MGYNSGEEAMNEMDRIKKILNETMNCIHPYSSVEKTSELLREYHDSMTLENMSTTELVAVVRASYVTREYYSNWYAIRDRVKELLTERKENVTYIMIGLLDGPEIFYSYNSKPKL